MSWLGRGFEQNRTAYRELTNDPENGILSGGFLNKQADLDTAHPITFRYYGGLLVLSGRGTYIGQDGEATPLGPGDFVQRLPGVQHMTPVLPDEPWEELFVCVGRTYYENLCSLGVIERRPVLHPGLDQELIQMMVDLLTHLEKSRSADGTHLLKATAILIRVTQLDAGRSCSSGSRLTILLDEALAETHDNLVATRTAAARTNLSYDQFRKRFSRETGTSPVRYAIEHRIKQARRLLERDRTAIESIALQLGYPDVATFSHQFRRFTGQSPSQYRQERYGL
jgi:AraC-like DNA-binding protein